MATFDKQKEYLYRLMVAEGHRKFGSINPRKEPKEDDDEGGSGGSELNPTSRAHPILNAAVQFSSDYNFESPLIPENPEADKQLALRLEAKAEKKLQAEKHIHPTPSRGM